MKRTTLTALALLAIVVVAFFPIFQNGFVGIDDGEYILHNTQVRSGITFQGAVWAFTNRGYASNLHPITWLSHMLDVTLFGLDPRGHHAVNLLIHAANTLLLFGVMRSY